MFRNITLLSSFALLLCCSNASAQLSGYVEESFESETFPPTGWTTQNVTGGYQWARVTNEHYEGSAAAWMRYQSTGGQDWLITPQFSVVSTDSITFRMKLDYQGYAPDSLSVKVSTTDAQTSSFTTTLLLLQEGVNYPPDDDNWYSYSLSLQAFAGQNVYVAFKHFNYDGDGLYLDDIKLGTKPPYDASAVAITSSMLYTTATPGPVTATIQNAGNFSETFNVTATITPGGYTSTQTVTSLAALATTSVSFDTWAPPAGGSYTLRVYTELATDLDHSNDTVSTTLTVFNTFPNYGWESSTPLPESRCAHALVFTKLCSQGDSAFLYAIGGLNSSISSVSDVFRQDLATGNWTTVASMPATRSQFSAVELGGKIYVPGGYINSFNPQNTLYIYDPLTDAWTTGATLPAAVGDYGIGTYSDSLIYVACGYNGSNDVSTVQIYNIRTNAWSTGTPFPGMANAGGRLGISGNKIVYAGGFSQTANSVLSAAWVGEINPANPNQITWTEIPGGLPFGAGTRPGGGAGLDDGRVYFVGGDPNGLGNAVRANVVAYNTLTSAWENGPSKPTAVSNISNFAFAIANDSLHMVCAGGHSGSSVLTTNERITIGPYTPAGASGGGEFCGVGMIQLEAHGGVSYDWSPAALLSDTTSASHTVTITQSETFTVTIEPRYGCSVADTFTATVYPVYTIDQMIEVCHGGSVTVGTETYTASGLYNDVLQTVDGCDSIVTTILTVLPLNTNLQYVSVCNGNTYEINGNTYTADGTYVDTLTAASGCDSIVTTVLTVLPPNTYLQDVTICDNNTIEINGNVYSTSGTYIDTLISAAGCDSIVTTVLTVLPTYATQENVTICEGDSYFFNGTLHDTPGTYPHLLGSFGGCDSLVTLVLSIASIDTTVTVSGATITANQAGASYEWFNCDTQEPIAGETGQSFTPAANGTYAAMILQGTCTQTSACTEITVIGLEELSQTATVIWPNPNNGSFTIRSTTGGVFTLTDEAGRAIAAFTIDPSNDQNVTFSDLQSGVYFLTSENGLQRKKIVVTH